MDEIARNGRQRRWGLCQRLEDGAGHKRLALHVRRRYGRRTDDWTEFMRTTPILACNSLPITLRAP